MQFTKMDEFPVHHHPGLSNTHDAYCRWKTYVTIHIETHLFLEMLLILSAVQSEDKPTRATRSKTSKATVAAAKKSATASTKAAATSNRKRKTEETDTVFEQQRTPQALTTSLINMDN